MSLRRICAACSRALWPSASTGRGGISAPRHPYPLSDFVLFPSKRTVQATSRLRAQQSSSAQSEAQH